MTIRRKGGTMRKINWGVVAIFVLMFWHSGFGWNDPHHYKYLFSRVVSNKSAERFKNYDFLSDSLGGMWIEQGQGQIYQQGGDLKIWNFLNQIIGTKTNVLDYQIGLTEDKLRL